MGTHDTRIGLVDIDQVSLTEWRAEAPAFVVNGKDHVLEPVHVTLTAHSWDTNTYSRLYRRDGRLVTSRAREKVETIVRGLIEQQVGDLIVVQRARWEIVLKGILRERRNHEEMLNRIGERERHAACQIKAHSLPGAQGEVARVLVRESWDKSPEELAEMVQILTDG